jgi:hypothetical protein
VEPGVHVDSRCEICGPVAVHCGRADPFGAKARLDTGVVLAKNSFANCFGLRQNFPRRAFVLAVFFSAAHVVFPLENGCGAVFIDVSKLI